MMLSLLTTLAFPVAFAAAESYVPKVIHELFGAKQPVDVEKTSDVQPDYCYFETEEPDLYCYKDGYPKCCTKDKGNCPLNNKPDCECEGSCNTLLQGWISKMLHQG
eukprot:CAMPEP_0202031876 /NCGR_PEP_ID=MMETSP0905-20130828/65243_1 /ASSEMBLY_ACC=CAM_ASM_000554 /TAXON_ID=420261 /ORGANISM="Thalassiosira antarctica, Strain CCMP982" /LENGTH=105 /DNA_ID=CAMNT_0048595725 /DNA_START=143 /DNA_END=460 /DNA_ORIENTATION=+